MYTEAQKSEIAEMLMHEGLAEIVTSSLSEQVAYLLAERAALMQKIQALENADTKTLSMKRTSMQATPDEKVSPFFRNVCYSYNLGFEAM